METPLQIHFVSYIRFKIKTLLKGFESSVIQDYI